jgi:hypothetical protein
MEYLSKIKKFVDASFVNAGDTYDLKHFERTVYWLLQLKSDADEALQVAAYGHDIERAFRERNYNKISQNEQGFISREHLSHHQETGAQIIADFLTKQGAPGSFVSKVKNLIEHHEIGGNDKDNLLKDADSLSYFENQIDKFIKNKVAEAGKSKVKQKFDWMFDRITSEKAKQIAKPMYENAIKRLG